MPSLPTPPRHGRVRSSEGGGHVGLRDIRGSTYRAHTFSVETASRHRTSFLDNTDTRLGGKASRRRVWKAQQSEQLARRNGLPPVNL
ncbi:hypothetical protein GCM10023220_40260 [Streptomyces ziwulingensis]|uniref:Uncharacterized protein n=1 Tax=Streptomyces ziwulingensis TaxID=1045501 RepID=A0ABP9C7M6_9ACTN